MLRSMYSGISGLKNFQTKLDVIGNNISNVNTYGFKKGRVVFKDLMSQTSAGASGPSGTVGGVNAKQVGLGSQLAAIDTIHGTGALQTTGRTLDLALEGEGFFIVSTFDAEEDPAVTDFKYTRAGNFYMDRDGFLVNSDGRYLTAVSTAEDGTPADPAFDPADPDYGGYLSLAVENGVAPAPEPVVEPTTDVAELEGLGFIQIPTNAQSMAVAQDGKVTFVGSDGILYYAGQLALAKFPNAEGLTKDGSNYYTVSANSGNPTFAAGTQEGIGKVVSGALEMSNVDLSEEFTEMIVAQRGFQATSRIITTSDEILQELVNLKR